MANADMCLEAARKAFPNNEELRGAYMIGFNEGFDRAMEQPKVDLENYLENYFKGWHIEEEIGLTKPDGWSCIVDDLKELARHFYELGLNARSK